MKKSRHSYTENAKRAALAVIAGLTLATAATAQVPEVISYQGRISSSGTNFTGQGLFKFALVEKNQGEPEEYSWMNSKPLEGQSDPADPVTISVEDGLFMVGLGDQGLANMETLQEGNLDQPNLHLRIWFDDGVNGFAQLTPDQPLTSVAYAMHAEVAAQVKNGAVSANQIAPGSINNSHLSSSFSVNANVADGSITTEKLANSAVTSLKLAPNAVTSSHIAGDTITSADVANDLDLLDLDLGGGGGSGKLQLWTPGIANPNSPTMPPPSLRGELQCDGAGAELTLTKTNGDPLAEVSSKGSGGSVTLNGNFGGRTIVGHQAITFSQTDNQVGASLNGADNGGALYLYNAAGGNRLFLYGGPNSGSIHLRNNAGLMNFYARSWEGEEGVVSLYNKNGGETMYLWGRNTGDTNAGQIGLKNGSGVETITLDADKNGEGRITTQVLVITGGSDLSEQFEIAKETVDPEPGMLVCIDPENPGHLAVSSKAYDYTAAGVISGAGGVKPGMVMGQAGTIADGEYPVALTGRVYCNVDAGYGSIEPGDMITTSDTPGHGMKVSDHTQAQGAIVGKAMTALESGTGQVLVLVSLQ